MKTYIAVLTETACDGQAYVQIHSSSSPEQLCVDIIHALEVETNERHIHFDYDEADLLDAVAYGNVASGPMDIEVTDHDSEFTLSTVVVTVPDAEVFKRIRKDAAARIKALMGRLGTDSLCSTDVSETEACWVADNYSDSRDTYTVDAVYLHGGEVIVDASGSSENISLTENSISVEALCNLAEWLEKYEHNISVHV